MVAGPISPLMLSAVAPLLRTNVVLRWDYDAEKLPDVTFHLWTSTNLMTSLYDWEIVGEVSGITAIELPITADAQRFYTVTASNWWGRSDFSNVAGTPPIPVTPQGLAIE